MRRHAREAATGVEDAREEDRKALKYGSAREASPDLAAGDELEFTDDKVRVVLMFLLLDNFVEWGNGGGGVKERAVVILTYSRMHATRVSAWHAS